MGLDPRQPLHRLGHGLVQPARPGTVLGAINVGTCSSAPSARLSAGKTITASRVIFLAILTGAQALINHMGIGLTARLTDFSRLPDLRTR